MGPVLPLSTLLTVPRPRILLGLVLALALAAPACGGGGKELDLATAEREIRKLAVRAYADRAEIGAVACPDHVDQEKGNDFTCTVEIDGEPLTIGVRQRDADGNVRIDQVEAVISNAKAEDFVLAYARRNGRRLTSVTCGKGSITTRAPGEIITCTVEFADGGTGTARMQVKDTDGNVGLQSLRRD